MARKCAEFDEKNAHSACEKIGREAVFFAESAESPGDLLRFMAERLENEAFVAVFGVFFGVFRRF
jgi:hypothetical protein